MNSLISQEDFLWLKSALQSYNVNYKIVRAKRGMCTSLNLYVINIKIYKNDYRK